jgi:S1-C subfamily serine protease
MSNVLSDLSDALAATVASAGSGVVRVDARRRLPATGFVWSEDGILVTAHHVLKRSDDISVGLPDGKEAAATLVGRDPTTDVAVLRVEASGLSVFTEAVKSDLGVGHFALALGRPGKTVQATLGIVSALGDSWRTRMGGLIDSYLQTDVVMYPGFSGGPLVNAKGHLVGMNTSALVPGVSLAIPVPTLANVSQALLAHGRVKRGYLGVSSQQARLPKAIEEGLGQKTGLLVVSVEADSPAEDAGLSLGDTIVALADSPVCRHDDLLALLAGDRVGKSTPVKVLRGGKVQSLDVVIGERP